MIALIKKQLAKRQREVSAEVVGKRQHFILNPFHYSTIVLHITGNRCHP